MPFETKYRKGYLWFVIIVILVFHILFILFWVLYFKGSEDLSDVIIVSAFILFFLYVIYLGEIKELKKLTLDEEGILIQYLFFNRESRLSYKTIVGYRKAYYKNWKGIALEIKNQKEEFRICEAFYKNYNELILELESREIKKID